MKRKLLAITVSTVLFALLIAGCSSKTKSTSSPSSSSPSSSIAYSNIKVEYIVQPSLDYGKYMPFSNGFAVVSNNKQSDQARYAFMDKNGKLLGDGFIYKYALSFGDDGLAVVEYEDGTYAFIDKTGKKVLDTFGGKKFNQENGIPDSFVNGLSVVTVVKDSVNISAVINAKGEIVIPFDFKNKYYYNPFYDNVTVRTADGKPDAVVGENGKVLFVSDKGLTGSYSDDVNFYTETSGSDVICGIIDKSGKKVTDLLYNLEPKGGFVDGLAFAAYADKSKGNAFIDTKGNVKFSIPDITGATVYDTVIVAKGKDDLQYIYDRTGQKLCNRGFHRITSFSNGVGSIYEDGKWGLIDTGGNMILRPQDDDCGDITCTENLVIVIQNDKMGIMEIKQ